MAFILKNTANVVIANGSTVFRVVAVYGNAIAVKAVQAVAGAKPHKATAVLKYGFDGTVWQALLNTDMFKSKLGRLRYSLPGSKKTNSYNTGTHCDEAAKGFTERFQTIS